MGFKVYVGGLPWEVEQDDLRAAFEEHGQILSAFVVYDKESGRSKGFGFVEYESEEDAITAIGEMDGVFISGRRIKVSKAKDSSAPLAPRGRNGDRPNNDGRSNGIQADGRKVFVGGLPWSFTEDELFDMMSEFGDVCEHNIVFDRETGQSKGFGFVEFDTAEAALVAIDQLDGTDMSGRTLRVRLAEVRPKGDRPGRRPDVSGGSYLSGDKYSPDHRQGSYGSRDKSRQAFVSADRHKEGRSLSNRPVHNWSKNSYENRRG